MLSDNSYVYKKEVDWSVLHEGVNIPVTIQVVFQNAIRTFLPRGQSKEIYLVLDGKTYKAILKNQRFDEGKYPKRKDILQKRYNPQSDIARRLRTISLSEFLKRKENIWLFIQQCILILICLNASHRRIPKYLKIQLFTKMNMSMKPALTTMQLTLMLLLPR
ncbi:MAG TPA: hypothetical protein PK830_07620 [Candidatus Atribacteria bacterium]|nr:hypothetical protein [Candidatus Atribacteria bacterium]